MTDSVLLDTNVFTSRLREKPPLASLYAKYIFGKRLLVTPQTLAEARYGALKANWGPVRLGRLAQLIARSRRLPVDPETIEAVAQLRNRCRLAGHGLHQREHNADVDCRRGDSVERPAHRARCRVHWVPRAGSAD